MDKIKKHIVAARPSGTNSNNIFFAFIGVARQRTAFPIPQVQLDLVEPFNLVSKYKALAVGQGGIKTKEHAASNATCSVWRLLLQQVLSYYQQVRV